MNRAFFNRVRTWGLSLAFTLGFGVSSHAQTHEVSGASSAALIFGDGSGLSINGEYLYNLYNEFPGIQAGAAFGFSNLGANRFLLQGEVVYNVLSQDKLPNAIFVGLGLGFESFSVEGGGSTDFVMSAFAGKRFELVKHVSFKPHVRLDRLFVDGFRVSIVPLSISILAL